MDATRGLKVTVLLGVCPVPVRLTVWRTVGSVSLIVMYPALAPAAKGVKVTLIMQLELGARELPQLFVWAKSPLAIMLMRLRLELPVFVSVIACTTLVV